MGRVMQIYLHKVFVPQHKHIHLKNIAPLVPKGLLFHLQNY